MTKAKLLLVLVMVVAFVGPAVSSPSYAETWCAPMVCGNSTSGCTHFCCMLTERTEDGCTYGDCWQMNSCSGGKPVT